VDGAEGNVEVQRLAADLFETASAMRRDGEAIARTAGQSQARWQVMWVASTGALTVPAIARRLGITRQGVQRVADDLVRAGLASYAPNPDHVKSPLLLLTDRGQDVLTRINDAAAERNLHLHRLVGSTDVRELRALLGKLRTALNGEDRSSPNARGAR